MLFLYKRSFDNFVNILSEQVITFAKIIMAEETELSKKSYEVVIPLHDKKESTALSGKHICKLSNEEESDDEDGRPKFNVWNGKNHSLPVLGEFSSDFRKNLHGFLTPTTECLVMDTFCRADLEYSCSEPPLEEGFLLWRNPAFSSSQESISGETCEQHCRRETKHQGNFESSDSEPEEEVLVYIQEKQRQMEAGENVTGEMLWYDDQVGEIRNLHENGSISLTKYEFNAPDEKCFGKTRILFDRLTSREKKMLQATTDNSDVVKSSREIYKGSGDFKA